MQFHFFGWAHTRGDGFVYLPKEKVLCTGDAVVNGPYNYTADANIGNWPAVVRAASKLEVTDVLPAHGVPGGKEMLAGQRQYFVELRAAVAAAIKQGKNSRISSDRKPKWSSEIACPRLRQSACLTA